MPIDLRVPGGARDGHRQSFDKPVVAVGRHPKSDLQFDPTQDLDVSTRHAEILTRGDRYRIRDNNSTNGTFINGRRITSEEELNDGDVIWLGAEGPHVEVYIAGSGTATDAAGAKAARSSKPRPSTGERVKVAVQRETAGMRRLLGAAAALLVVGVGGAYWLGHRESRTQLQELMQILAESESTAAHLQAQLDKVGDTTLLNAVRLQNAEIAQRVRASGSDASPEEIDALKDELRRRQAIQQGLVAMDLSKISERNDRGVAFLVTELDGRPYGGTAFGITPRGLLVTNKHNVRSEQGRTASRIGVKFANTDVLLHAHLVKVSDDDADLALIQVDEPGTYPTIAGVARSLANIRVGSPVMTIGFPHALDTPMDGQSVKTSLTAGTVSKLLPSLLQVDSYAAHGSSGSPIFDPDGWVIGVVYGGPKESQGRLVYAVPSERLVSLLPAEAAGILR